MLRVGDNHSHLNPLKGIGVHEFAKRFINSGGWFVCLVNLTSWSYGLKALTVEDYERVYRITVDTAKSLREKGVKVGVLLGPHPAELARLVEEGIPSSEAERLIIEAYRIASDYVGRGEADGLGEVGRPHWPASSVIIEACNVVLDEVLSMASDLDCVVHIHAEQAGKQTVDDLSKRLKGCRKVVYHHIAGRYAGYAFERGLIPSVPAKEEEILNALSSGENFVVESDFLDDPRRPGAVVAPWSISRVFNRLISKGSISVDGAKRILVSNIEKLYDVRLEA